MLLLFFFSNIFLWINSFSQLKGNNIIEEESIYDLVFSYDSSTEVLNFFLIQLYTYALNPNYQLPINNILCASIASQTSTSNKLNFLLQKSTITFLLRLIQYGQKTEHPHFVCSSCAYSRSRNPGNYKNYTRRLYCL